jgi:hypothetical protein
MSLVGDILKGIAPSIVGLGTGLIMNNQNVKAAQGQANTQKELLELQIQNTKEQQKLLLQSQQGTGKTETKSNLPLYIGIGLGGFLVLGVVIFAITRK